jgi:hypothetical protein
MIIDAVQHKDVTVEISEDEIYRITKAKILDIYDLPEGVEIRGKNLVKVTRGVQDMTPYSGEDIVEVLRVANDTDIEACSVLWRLATSQ